MLAKKTRNYVILCGLRVAKKSFLGIIALYHSLTTLTLYMIYKFTAKIQNDLKKRVDREHIENKRSYLEIAKEIGVTYQTFNNWFRTPPEKLRRGTYVKLNLYLYGIDLQEEPEDDAVFSSDDPEFQKLFEFLKNIPDEGKRSHLIDRFIADNWQALK